jgi:multidrug efflux pump
VALSEQRLGYFIRSGEQYEVIAQVEADRRDDPAGLRGLYVRSAAGVPILLANLVTVRESAAPPQRYRFNRFEAATVNAQPAPGVTLGAALDAMDAVADEVLPEGFSRDVTGQSRDFRESSGSLTFVFVLALVLIYLVLAAQFESFRDPFIIMLTVPLALVGALGFLWYFDATLNVFSQIGLVMLIGLVTKNGILIVEFARQRQAAGATVLEAAREGAAARFRPILMTSAATILGTLPIALALGAGAESRTPMGLAVIGGLAVGTLLSLFVVPAMYTFFAGAHVHVETEAEAVAPVAVAPVAVAADGAAGVPGGDGAADGAADAVPRAATREEAADA